MKPVVVVEFRARDAADLPLLIQRVEGFLRSRPYPHDDFYMPARVVSAREEPIEALQRPQE